MDSSTQFSTDTQTDRQTRAKMGDAIIAQSGNETGGRRRSAGVESAV